jgi:hypothetical protein
LAHSTSRPWPQRHHAVQCLSLSASGTNSGAAPDAGPCPCHCGSSAITLHRPSAAAQSVGAPIVLLSCPPPQLFDPTQCLLSSIFVNKRHKSMASFSSKLERMNSRVHVNVIACLTCAPLRLPLGACLQLALPVCAGTNSCGPIALGPFDVAALFLSGQHGRGLLPYFEPLEHSLLHLNGSTPGHASLTVFHSMSFKRVCSITGIVSCSVSRSFWLRTTTCEEYLLQSVTCHIVHIPFLHNVRAEKMQFASISTLAHHRLSGCFHLLQLSGRVIALSSHSCCDGPATLDMHGSG